MFNKHDDDELLFSDDDDELMFAEDSQSVQASTTAQDMTGFQAPTDLKTPQLNPSQWKVLIVDDEPEIHTVTKMVLSDFEFDDKTLEFIDALSGQEAVSLLHEHPDIALVLLDVVMESDDAGLKVARYIREQLKNQAVRIILRTGQPGHAPEKKVIIEYDINDYKEKTELTSQKLYTTFVGALRTYRDIKIIEDNKKGLEHIIESAKDLFKHQSMQKFASAVLEQLTALLGLDKSALHLNSLALTKGDQSLSVMAATGRFQDLNNEQAMREAGDDVRTLMEQAMAEKRNLYRDGHIVCYFKSATGEEYVMYLHSHRPVEELDRTLIEIYSTNVSAAYDNLHLNEELEKTQREIIFTLGEIAETRSKETGNHVRRVAEYSKLLAQKAGLPEEEVEIIRLASPMHDVGKIGIPDEVLKKPGKLTDEEFAIMKTHAMLGYQMLNCSSRTVMKAAATIALDHHEKYNGGGYPNGKKGEEIHLYGRIVAVADVFDALCADRVYKKAWSHERVYELFQQERGQHFDPVFTDILLENFDEFIAIKDKYNDLNVF